jgi:hypothetical protein
MNIDMARVGAHAFLLWRAIGSVLDAASSEARIERAIAWARILVRRREFSEFGRVRRDVSPVDATKRLAPGEFAVARPVLLKLFPILRARGELVK